MCALSDWFCANKLSLNAQKTNFMVFSPKNKPTNITSSTRIHSLSDFSSQTKKDIPKLFVSHLEKVFQYTQTDIIGTLGKMEMDTLSCIHKQLVDKIRKSFSRFADKRTPNRIVLHTMTKDIWYMGFCLVNKAPTKDLEKIFTITDGNQVTSENAQQTVQTEMAHMLTSIVELRSLVKSLQVDVEHLKDENTLLRTQIATLPIHEVAPQTVTSSAENNNPTHNTDITHDPDGVHSNPESSREDESPVSSLPQSSEVNNSYTSCSSDDDKDEDENFEFQHQYKKKLHKLEKRLSKLCNKHVSDKGNDYSKSSNIYIGGVDPIYRESDVSQYIKSLGVKCGPIQMLAKKPDWVSYKVTVSQSDVKTVLDRSNWSESITVWAFRWHERPRPHQQYREGQQHRSGGQGQHHRYNRQGRREQQHASNGTARWNSHQSEQRW